MRGICRPQMCAEHQILCSYSTGALLQIPITGPAGCPGNSTPLQYSEQQASKETLLSLSFFFLTSSFPFRRPSSKFFLFLSPFHTTGLTKHLDRWRSARWKGVEAFPIPVFQRTRPHLSEDELSPAGRTFTLNFTPRVVPAWLTWRFKVAVDTG